MARMRSIKPEFWADQKLTLMPREVRLLYIALWNFADEEGRLQGDTRLVKSWCFPLDDDVNAEVLDKWLGSLVDAGKLVRYESDGAEYLHLTKLSSHQKLDPRLPSRYPAPPNQNATPIRTDQSVSDQDSNACAQLPEGAKHVASSREHVAGGRAQAPPRCAKHKNLPPGPGPACVDCRDERVAAEKTAQAAADERKRQSAAKALARANCRRCNGTGRVEDPDTRLPTDEICNHAQRASAS